MGPHHADQQRPADRGGGSSITQVLIPGTVVDGPLEAGTLHLQVLAAITINISLNNNGGYEGGIVHSLGLGKGDGEQVAQHAELQRGDEELGTDNGLVAQIQVVAHIQTGLIQGEDLVELGLRLLEIFTLELQDLVLGNPEEGAKVAGERTENGVQANSRQDHASGGKGTPSKARGVVPEDVYVPREPKE